MAERNKPWVEPIFEGTTGNRFNLTDNGDGSVQLEHTPTILNEPTPFSAARMNSIEERIDEASDIFYVSCEYGKSLLNLFKANSIYECMAEIRRRCNNNGEIDSSKIPDFRGIRIGDYIDLPSLNDGTTNFVWNDSYKNLRIVVSGFNHYKGAGDNENTKNHILFTFRNCVTIKQMNATNTNTGGYAATELRTYLEGVFALGLKQAIGDYLYPVSRLLSTKGGWAWGIDTVFIPTEREVWGFPSRAEVENDAGAQGQYPIFVATAYKGKKYNGSRMWWWEASPQASSAASFCRVSNSVTTASRSASEVGGIAPAFCVS